MDITIYYGNNYNLEDMPLNESVLAAHSSVYTIENASEIISNIEPSLTLRVNITKYIARTANFVKLYSWFYYITDYKMLNAQVCEFQLIIEPFLSFGLFETQTQQRTSITGNVSRITPTAEENPTVSAGSAFAAGTINLTPEEYAPSERKRTGYVSTGYPSLAGRYYYFLTSTILLSSVSQTSEYIAHYNTDTNTLTGYTFNPPDVKGLGSDGATVQMNIGENVYRSKMIGRALYLMYDSEEKLTGTADFETLLGNLQAIGLSDSIKDIWRLPSEYVEIGTRAGATNRISSIKTPHTTTIDNQGPVAEGTLTAHLTDQIGTYTPNNLKALYLYSKIIVEGRASGYTKTFEYGHIIDKPEDELQRGNASFSFFVNGMPEGRPYISPVNYDGMKLLPNTFQYCVSGGQWQKPSLALQGKSGSELDTFFTNQELDRSKLNALTASVSGIGGMIASGLDGKIGGVVQSGLSMASSLANTALSNDQARAENELKHSVYSPTYMPPGTEDLSVIVDNNFTIRWENLSDNDMRRLDQYLTKYGWADNVPIPQSTGTQALAALISERGNYFCYIKMSSVTVNSMDWGIEELTNYVVARLMAGIRVWKNAGPSERLYSADNTKRS